MIQQFGSVGLSFSLAFFRVKETVSIQRAVCDYMTKIRQFFV